MNLADYLASRRSDIRTDMQSTIGGDPSLVAKIARYHLGLADCNGAAVPAGGGKQLRAGLCLLACEALGGGRAALPAATALELFHAFTLLHDDIMDRDAVRRGSPAAWTIWGEATAINAGDYLFAKAFVRIGQLAESDPGLGACLSARLAETATAVVAGQQLDLDFEERATVSVDQYEEMISLKTAALFELALEFGARCAATAAEPWRKLGFELGMAFQIRDDILGVWGDPQVTGKPVGGDLRRGKKALPALLLAHETGQPVEATASERQIEEVLGEMASTGIRGKVDQMLGARVKACQALVESLPVQTRYEPVLSDLIAMLADRDH